MAGRLLFRYFYGLSQEKREWVNLAEVRAGQLPAPGAVDFQAVPLCLQKTAKGGANGPQLASLRQVSPLLQRSHPQAKRKPDSRIKALLPGDLPLGVVGYREKNKRRITAGTIKKKR